jgi:alpha-ketoglutarate-dependent taurine dioxygenase
MPGRSVAPPIRAAGRADPTRRHREESKSELVEATRAALREDLWRYKVLIFRDQNLLPDEQVEAVRIWDDPFDHPLRKSRDEANRLV